MIQGTKQGSSNNRDVAVLLVQVRSSRHCSVHNDSHGDGADLSVCKLVELFAGGANQADPNGNLADSVGRAAQTRIVGTDHG